MRYVSYILDAEEPVKMGDQGNQANCDALSYIAGSAIRGAVIAECVKAAVKVEELVKNTRFYDAYIVTDDEYAAPIPFVYYADKHAIRENELRMQSDTKAELPVRTCLAENPKEGEQRVDVGGYGRYGEGGQLATTRVRKTANLHIKVGQTGKDKPMYRYEAIEERQSLGGAIVCEDEDTAEMYRDLIVGKTLYLGGSKGSGYGRCHVRNVDVLTYDQFVMRYGICRKDEEGILVVYALSNLLLNDDLGAPAGEISAKKLETALGIADVSLIKSFAATGVSGGFNHTWRAGNVQRNFVKAGSVFVYTYSGTLNRDKVSDFEEAGVGMRRQDGFGRILVNPDLTREKRVVSDKRSAYEDVVLSAEDREVLSLISREVNERRYQKAIENAALQCADKNSGLVKQFSLTQTARLWQFMSELAVFGVSDKVIKDRAGEFYDKINARKTVTGETAARTSGTASSYSTSKIVLPGGDRITVNELLEDLKTDAKEWGTIVAPLLEFRNLKWSESTSKKDSSLKTKVRLLSAVLYDLMRKEGGKKR